MSEAISIQEQAEEIVPRAGLVTLKNGETLEVRPIHYLQMIEMVPFVESLAGKLFVRGADGKTWADPTQIVFKGGEDLTHLLMIAVDRPREFFARPASDVVKIVAEVWRINRDFFIQEELETIKGILGPETLRLATLLFEKYKTLTRTLSNSSSATDTPSAKSSVTRSRK